MVAARRYREVTFRLNTFRTTAPFLPPPPPPGPTLSTYAGTHRTVPRRRHHGRCLNHRLPAQRGGAQAGGGGGRPRRGWAGRGASVSAVLVAAVGLTGGTRRRNSEGTAVTRRELP